VALVLAACVVSPSPPPSPTSSVAATPGDRLAEVRRTVDGLARAALTDDRSAFLGLVSDRDPTFASRARLLYTNLSTMPLTELTFTPEPGEQSLSADRQERLGPDAWVQSVLVSWRLTADDRSALHRVSLTFVAESGETRLAGTFDGPAPAPPAQQPSWWRGPLSVREQDRVTVLAGSGQPVDRWSAVVRSASAAVRRDLPAPVPDELDDVVVEVPATPADFAAVLGQPAERYAAIAAVAHQVGEGDRPPLRVVINPRSGTLVGADQLAEIIRHEIVHLATRSPESPAPLWAVEGLAEWVALRDRPGAASSGTADLLSAVRRNGPPRSLPPDEAFAAGQVDLNRAYAEAWLACRYIAETYSVADLGRLYAELDRGRSLDDAGRAVLGVEAAELTRGWRRFVAREARSR
jgi:hypothetical protein